MEANPSAEGSTSSSEDGLFTAALRKMMKKEIQVMMFDILPQVIMPIMKECIRQVVNEEIPSAIEKYFSGGNRINSNSVPVPDERSLHLKFLNEVSDDVLTGKEIKGEGGTPMRVAIVDDATGQVIKNGPESFAKVEILFLEASENDNDFNWSHENFVRRIIKQSDKTKPHFAKHFYVYLENGIAELSDAKLANGSNWTRSCTCRLGAQVVENLGGVNVQKAWTKPFVVVSDSCSNLYEKHYPPSLSDEVWRLCGIGRSGERYKRLKKNNILTVQDLLFFRAVDPRRLQEIIDAGDTVWKGIEDHVHTCNIDGSTICVYNNSSEHNMSVVFDVVGMLKGVIQDAQYVLKDYLSETEKAHAHKLLRSAFDNRSKITFLKDEMTLVQQYPYRGIPIQESVPVGDSQWDNEFNFADVEIAADTLLMMWK